MTGRGRHVRRSGTELGEVGQVNRLRLLTLRMKKRVTRGHAIENKAASRIQSYRTRLKNITERGRKKRAANRHTLKQASVNIVLI